MTRSEINKAYQEFKSAVENSFLEAATLFREPFILEGRGHDPRVTVSSKIGKIISNIDIPRTSLASGGPKGTNFYPHDLVHAAESIMRDRFGYPGLEEHGEIIRARFALNEKKHYNKKIKHKTVNFEDNKNNKLSQNIIPLNIKNLLEGDYIFGKDYFVPHLMLTMKSWDGTSSTQMIDKLSILILKENYYSSKTHEMLKIFILVTEKFSELYKDIILKVYEHIKKLPSRDMIILNQGEPAKIITKLESLLK